MEHDPGRTDGPGSFGPLHATVTLDCLTYVGSVSRDGREWVLIRDERGVVHRLTLGGYMGPGVITRIDAEFIYLEASPSGIVRFAKAPR
jgi:Tfp pilus assembly protein PilP